MRAEDLDLRELLSYPAAGGVFRFMGQRAVLMDAVALGVQRKELIASLGLFATRGMVTRLGYSHGWRTGEMLRDEHPDVWAAGKAGPRLPQLTGASVVRTNVRTDGLGAAPLVESVVEDSFEAEQHLLHVGRSDGPVCWNMSGFASGYLSFKEGRPVYVIEDRCVGMGDAHCHLVARFEDRWGPEFDAHRPYFEMTSLDSALTAITARLRRMERRLLARKQELGVYEAAGDAPAGVVARSEGMRHAIELARRTAPTHAAILVTGESGVGKEVVARLVHAESRRAGRAFVSLNCGAIAESLVERELFGHVRGAFTGAERDSPGLFEAANGGTLFLDEVGELPLAAQVRLLRALQEREIRRVGETRSRAVDVRVIAATNRELSREVAAGRFRKDLYYRLRVIEVAIPPLRDRPEDVLPLARLFLRKVARETGRPVTGLDGKAAARLAAYDWPGNVRELQNAIEHAVALCDAHQVGPKDLPAEVRSPSAPRPRTGGAIRPLEEVEREHVLRALELSGGNKAAAAAALGIGLATLYRKVKAYGAGWR